MDITTLIAMSSMAISVLSPALTATAVRKEHKAIACGKIDAALSILTQIMCKGDDQI